MDKIVGIKRKAQRFVQSGDLHKAVAEYERLVEFGEMDPYDFVYLGDLLVRISRLNDAVGRYREAIVAYERVSLFKNAVAVGKKILRIRPESFDVHRLLGELYFLEGLYNDSLFYYMQFLSAAPPHSESASIEEVGLRLLGMPIPTAHVALSVVSTMTAANCGVSAARPLYALAQDFERRGQIDQAETLKRRAIELDPSAATAGVAANPPSSASPELPPAREPMGSDPSAANGSSIIELDPAAAFAPPLELESAPEFTPSSDEKRGASGNIQEDSHAEWSSLPDMVDLDHAQGPPDDFGMIDLASGLAGSAPDEDADVESAGTDRTEDSFPGAHHDIGDFVGGNGNGTGAPEAEVGRSNGMAAFEDGNGSGMNVPDCNVADGAPDEDLLDVSELLAHDRDVPAGDVRALIARGEEHLSNGDTARGLRVLLAAGRVAFNAGESRTAERVYGDIVKLDPNHLEALQGLTEIAHINGERAKIVRHGCELGDVLLARERYAEAKLEFERVLQFDPENEKAKARVRRLNTIDGLESVTARPLAPVASEVRGATVSVRPEPTTRTQSILDLSVIMSEFQTAVSAQFPVEDAQSHYDLGMTYQEMGMVNEAVSEFEIASDSPLHRSRALEMMTRVLVDAGRAGEALEILDKAAGLPGNDEPGREANLFACRGLALEGLGRANEARRAFEQAILLDSDLIVAREGVERLGGPEDTVAA